MARVVLADPESAGLAAMVAALVEAGAADPSRCALLERMRGTVTIDVPDAEVTVGLRFADGVCHVATGGIAGSDVTLTMPADVLLELPSTPLLGGLPSVLDPRGRAFASQVLRRRVRISGLRHAVLITQLTRLLSVA